MLQGESVLTVRPIPTTSFSPFSVSFFFSLDFSSEAMHRATYRADRFIFGRPADMNYIGKLAVILRAARAIFFCLLSCSVWQRNRQEVRHFKDIRTTTSIKINLFRGKFEFFSCLPDCRLFWILPVVHVVEVLPLTNRALTTTS